jgi:hypothetical protein
VVAVGVGLPVAVDVGADAPCVGVPPVRFPSPEGRGDATPDEQAPTNPSTSGSSPHTEDGENGFDMFLSKRATVAPPVAPWPDTWKPDQVNVISGRIVEGQ